MFLPIVAALAIFALLSLPGWLLAADRQRSLWFFIAAGFASQMAIILVTAIIARLSPIQLDVRLVLVLAIIAIGAVIAFRRGGPWIAPERPDPILFLVPVVATLFAAFITSQAISLSDGDLLVRAWFNADGFKHLGHVQSLANLGLSARDIFGADQPLAYYWLFYSLPGIGAALHRDAASALIASGLVQTFAFWLLVQGLLRLAGANAAWAAVLALLAFLSPTPDGLLALGSTGWNLVDAATTVNVEGMAGGLLSAMPIFRLSLYTPQHQLMLAGLLSWAILVIAGRQEIPRPLHILAFAPLVAAGAISTLFGVACLGVFGLYMLLDSTTALPKRIGIIVLVGLAALATPLFLGVVDLGGGSGLDSPIFASERERPAAAIRFAGGLLGIILAFGVSLIGLAGLYQALRSPGLARERRSALNLALALVGTGFFVLLATTLIDNPRIGLEVQLRASLLPQIGLLLGFAFLLTGAVRQILPPIWTAIAAPLVILGMTTPVLDTIWHAASSEQWTITVPEDDLAVLGALDRDAPKTAVVLQYPELPYLSGGRDIWAAILGGRTVYASHRTTNFGAQADRLAAASTYYAGTAPLPEGDYQYVYLSRALHPQSYDALSVQLDGAGWLKQDCRPDACLYRRD